MINYPKHESLSVLCVEADSVVVLVEVSSVWAHKDITNNEIVEAVRKIH